jgi:hypothetical protein
VSPYFILNRALSGRLVPVLFTMYVTMIHCPLDDGRSDGSIGLVVTQDGTWYNPADGGCRAGASQDNWKKWLDVGYTSKAQAEAATKK